MEGFWLPWLPFTTERGNPNLKSGFNLIYINVIIYKTRLPRPVVPRAAQPASLHFTARFTTPICIGNVQVAEIGCSQIWAAKKLLMTGQTNVLVQFGRMADSSVRTFSTSLQSIKHTGGTLSLVAFCTVCPNSDEARPNHANVTHLSRE